jgi:AraC-like DNA-binding protein
LGHLEKSGEDLSTSAKSTRTCWRAVDLEDAVLFNAAYNREFIPHSHDATTVLAVTEGAVELGVGDAKYITSKGQMAIIGAHQIHSAQPVTPGGWRMRSIHLPSALIAEALRLPPSDCIRTHFSRPVQTGLPISSIFLDLHQSAESSTTTARDLRSFIKDLYRNIDAYGPTDWNVCSIDERVAAAQRLLANPAVETMQICEVAEEVGLSVFVLIRQFWRTFGLSPSAWRMQARANEAARLLRERKQAAEAAILSGFSDQSHMARTFKKVYGITPGQYSMMHTERAGSPSRH